jgi:multidrug efflux pump
VIRPISDTRLAISDWSPGFSSGQAQAAIDKIAADVLPKGIGYEWTDLTYLQILAGSSGMLVYLVLAAQYESLTLPLAIIMIVPMGVLAALAGVWLTGGDNNIFTQIGLIVLVGLSAKNAILIVEFARELEFEGRTPVQAAIESSRLRLRPILMTSMAFIMGVAVFSGMSGVTFFGIFMVPVFYVLARKLTGNRPLIQHGEAAQAEKSVEAISVAAAH